MEASQSDDSNKRKPSNETLQNGEKELRNLHKQHTLVAHPTSHVRSYRYNKHTDKSLVQEVQRSLVQEVHRSLVQEVHRSLVQEVHGSLVQEV